MLYWFLILPQVIPSNTNQKKYENIKYLKPLGFIPNLKIAVTFFNSKIFSCQFEIPQKLSWRILADIHNCFSEISKWLKNIIETAFFLSSVIRWKGESENGCLKKTKHVKFSEKRTFLIPWFALLPYYRQSVTLILAQKRATQFFLPYGLLTS